MNKLDELKQEATDLGVTYSPNIGESKLQSKIDEHYEGLETSGKAINDAITAKEQEEITVASVMTSKDDEELAGRAIVASMEKKVVAKKLNTQQRSKAAEKKARATRVVEIIDNDPRVNAHATTCSPTCGNEYFDLGTIILPLNTPVEVMQGHINSLKEVEFPHHQMNQKTGLNSVGLRKRYTVSFVQ
jgi:hypothetical protein